MVKTLRKVGNSYALPIDKALMEALNVTPDTPLMITVQDGKMTVVAADIGFTNEDIDEFFDDIRPDYDGMLENLAQ